MSNLKNVLKAGFLLSASLLATGCETDNPGTPITTPTNNKPLTLALDAGSFEKLNMSIMKINGTISSNFNVFDKIGVYSSGTLATASSPTADSYVSLVDMPADVVLLDSTKATSGVGALFLEGQLDPNKRVVAKANVSGALKINALAVRNAVLNGATTTAAADSINSQYAYVGIDAALGYESARVNATGGALEIPLDINAQISSLSAGVAKASKSTKVTKISAPAAAMAKQKAATPPVAHANKLTLNMTVPDGVFANKLNDAGLTVHDNQGGLDIAGRVASVTATNAVITSVSDQLPELVLPASATTATVDKKTTKTSLALSAGAATAKAKKAVNSTQASAKALVSKDAISQSLVKQSGGTHHFLYEIKQGGYSAEIGSLAVGEKTDIQVIAHHALVVHDLNLNADLGVRLYVEGHTWDKLSNTTTWASISTDGQAMMKMLAANDHAVHESDIVEEGKATIQYQHFDSNTPFAMYVTNSVTNGTGTSSTAGPGTHNLVLRAIDFAPGQTIEAGVYAMPLVKDFTGVLSKLKENDKSATVTLATPSTLIVKDWKIMSNGYHDLVLFANVETGGNSLGLGSGVVTGLLMGSKAQDGRSVLTATVDGVVERLNPTNLIAASFANLSTSRINQAAQFASLARGVNGTTTAKLGAVEQYAVSFNHNGTQVGFTYNLEGGNAFAGAKGSTSFGANVASDVLGLKAIVSVDASADAGKNAYATVSNASYNAGLTFAKAYSLGGLSVVPMTGFGVASNALNGYSAVVPMAAGSLGLHMNDVAFSAATYHAGVNVALDEFVAASAGVNASLAFGVAGYLAATADAKLSTSEGKSADLQFGGSSVTPYAQFNVGFASGEKVNALISSSAAAVSFGIDR